MILWNVTGDLIDIHQFDNDTYPYPYNDTRYENHTRDDRDNDNNSIRFRIEMIIDYYNSLMNSSSLDTDYWNDEHELTNNSVVSLKEALFLSLKMESPAYVICPRFGEIRNFTLFLNMEALYPLTGIYSNEKSDTLYVLVSNNIDEAISSGAFTSYLQSAAFLYGSYELLNASSSKIPKITEVSRYNSIDSNSADSDVKVNLTIVVIASIFAIIFISGILHCGYIARKNYKKNLELSENLISSPLIKKNVDVWKETQIASQLDTMTI